MWGWWDSSDRVSRLVRVLIIGVIVSVIVSFLFSGTGIRVLGSNWWMFFVFLPILFGGSRRSRRRRYGPLWDDEELREAEKRKNEELEAANDYEKPKHVEYRLGDDGELIEAGASDDSGMELESEEDDETTIDQPPARRISGSDRSQYV